MRFLVAAVLALELVGCSTPVDVFNRDNYEYGHSKSVVRSKFAGTFSVEEENFLVGKTLVDGESYWLAFGFIDDRLVTIELFASNHLDGPLYPKVPMTVNRDATWDANREYKDIRRQWLRKYGDHETEEMEDCILFNTPAEFLTLYLREASLLMRYGEKEDPRKWRMFWEPVFLGDELTPPHLRTSRRKQDADYPENTSEMFSLSTKQAAELVAKFRGKNLDLSGLISIDEEVAKELVKFEGEQLDLGLSSIDKNVARELATFKGEMWLSRPISIEKDVARELSKFKGELIISWLREPSDEVLEILKSNLKIKF